MIRTEIRVVATALLVASLMAGSAMAQVVPPTAADKPEPPMPQGPMGLGPEGWVRIAYTVTPDGSTANVRVLESQPAGLNPAEVVATVQAWQFEPATADGTAIEWHNNVEMIVFDIEDVGMVVSPQFAEAFGEVAELMDSGRMDRARTRNASMQSQNIAILYELGLANMQLAEIEIALENYHAAYEAVVRATHPEVTQLPPDELLAALQYRFAIEVQLGRAADAMQTYERVTALGAVPDDDPAAAQLELLSNEIEEGAILAIGARVTGDEWRYTPMRRTFAVGDVDGSLDELRIECNRRTATLEFQEDVEWAIPASWGDCRIAFAGRRGTTFTFFEIE